MKLLQFTGRSGERFKLSKAFFGNVHKPKWKRHQRDCQNVTQNSHEIPIDNRFAQVFPVSIHLRMWLISNGTTQSYASEQSADVFMDVGVLFFANQPNFRPNADNMKRTTIFTSFIVK